MCVLIAESAANEIYISLVGFGWLFLFLFYNFIFMIMTERGGDSVQVLVCMCVFIKFYVAAGSHHWFVGIFDSFLLSTFHKRLQTKRSSFGSDFGSRLYFRSTSIR